MNWNIDAILKVVGVGAIVALGVPVAVSVKYEDGQAHASELHDEFGIAAWSIAVRAPFEFSSLKAELFHRQDASGQGGNVSIGSLQHTFASGRKNAEVRVYGSGQQARILCDGAQATIALPVDLAPRSEQGGAVAFHGLGGKGLEVAPRTFELLRYADGSIAVEVTVQ